MLLSVRYFRKYKNQVKKALLTSFVIGVFHVVILDKEIFLRKHPVVLVHEGPLKERTLLGNN